MKRAERQVIYRDIEELELLSSNPRKITPDMMEKLKTSIRENEDYFECRPVILSDRTGKLVVIAGNQRVTAARALGMKQVPTVVLSGLTEEREKEIIIRDNVNNGEWDEELLKDWDADLLSDWGVEGLMDDLIRMDDLNFDKKDLIKNEFVVSFVFDNELKETFDRYFKEKGKKDIVKLIIDTICQDAEAK